MFKFKKKSKLPQQKGGSGGGSHPLNSFYMSLREKTGYQATSQAGEDYDVTTYIQDWYAQKGAANEQMVIILSDISLPVDDIVEWNDIDDKNERFEKSEEVFGPVSPFYQGYVSWKVEKKTCPHLNNSFKQFQAVLGDTSYLMENWWGLWGEVKEETGTKPTKPSWFEVPCPRIFMTVLTSQGTKSREEEYDGDYYKYGRRLLTIKDEEDKRSKPDERGNRPNPGLEFFQSLLVEAANGLKMKGGSPTLRGCMFRVQKISSKYGEWKFKRQLTEEQISDLLVKNNTLAQAGWAEMSDYLTPMEDNGALDPVSNEREMEFVNTVLKPRMIELAELSKGEGRVATRSRRSSERSEERDESVRQGRYNQDKERKKGNIPEPTLDDEWDSDVPF